MFLLRCRAGSMNQAHIITHANTAAVTQATDMRNTKSTTKQSACGDGDDDRETS
jgi:hypothetical protein